MDIVAQGFLLGIGIVLAVLMFAAIALAVVFIVLFFSYLTGRRKAGREMMAQTRIQEGFYDEG